MGYQEEEGGSVVTLITYQPNSGAAVTINKSTSQSDWLSREEYESIPNEKRHYSPIIITAPGTYYMVRNTFMDGEVPYTTGQQIEEETFNALGSIKQANIDKFTFVAPTGTEADKNKAVTNPQTTDSEGNKVYDPKTYYYCRDAYTIDEKGEGKDVTTTEVNKNGSVVSSVTYKKANAEVEGSTDEQVPQGVVINEKDMPLKITELLETYNPNILVNGYNSENSFTRATLKENIVQQVNKNIQNKITPQEVSPLKAVPVKLDTSNIITEEINNYNISTDVENEDENKSISLEKEENIGG